MTQILHNWSMIQKSSSLCFKSNNCLNELSYFHAAEGVPPDLAYEVFEGIAVDVISDVVGGLVGKKNIFHCQNSIT